jgi:aryl-alcohol dehydrogenase-like predicted oxidoreductase
MTYAGAMIETAPFGNTGHQSTRVIFGAAALGSVSQVEADRALDVLLEHGINHIDTAASYGESELRLAPWLREHRDRFFLATKTGERSHDAARDEIRRSLDRMGVDQVDLIQLHCLVHPAEWDLAMSGDGVLRAAVEARDEGLVRFIGVTGHGLTVAEMHRRSLERFPFDAVLFPFSHVIVQDRQYARDVERLLSSCRERGVAVQTIKGISRGPWGSSERSAATWYEPLTDQDDIDLAVQWVLGEPGVFLNSPGDLDLLPRVLDAAERFESRPGEAAMAALLEGRRLSSLFV